MCVHKRKFHKIMQVEPPLPMLWDGLNNHHYWHCFRFQSNALFVHGRSYRHNFNIFFIFLHFVALRLLLSICDIL